jgi:hypothetical protein
MGEVCQRREHPSTNSVEQLCKFGTIVRALWPNKPALNLAQRIGSSERGAQYLIDGERKVTARAIAVIIAEIVD